MQIILPIHHLILHSLEYVREFLIVYLACVYYDGLYLLFGFLFAILQEFSNAQALLPADSLIVHK